MGRVAFTIFAAVVAFAVLSDAPSKELFDANYLWAAMLPAIYFFGLAFLEE